ncbi:hypothetical protein I6F09_06080 [Bradyrhizobium sp. IC3195]|uniref:hypothetical protein n=1 Tax=Bradyrhizobium sp. IC3195 TaxID=2793804 RepID=UPI001CD7F1F4|nr:hypothetical protein [Bradyrhizobium sp. IC3195]MCA1467451.1 hypothetical protein [Bradyrhizobium sp. IC3195]
MAFAIVMASSLANAQPRRSETFQRSYQFEKSKKELLEKIRKERDAETRNQTYEIERIERLSLLNSVVNEYISERKSGPELSQSTFYAHKAGKTDSLSAVRLFQQNWQNNFSAAVVDFLPRTAKEFKSVYETDRVSKKDVDEITAWQADETSSRTTIDRFGVDDAFMGSRGVLIFIGHSVEGQIVDRAGNKHSILALSKRCAITMKLCVFLSCRAAQVLPQGSPFAPAAPIGGRQAVNAMLEIVGLFSEAKKRLDQMRYEDQEYPELARLQDGIDELRRLIRAVDSVVERLTDSPLYSLETTVSLKSSAMIVLTVALLVGGNCTFADCEAQ